jgi:hypothetical protein
MATDTSTGEDSISINLDMSSLDLSFNGINQQDIITAGYPSITGTNGIYTTIGTSTSNPWLTVNDGRNTLSVQGDADFDGDVRVQGRSLAEFMEQVEQRLNMLQPNPELEQEWDELRELGARYRELEQQCKEKAKMWKKLKQMPPPEVK